MSEQIILDAGIISDDNNGIARSHRKTSGAERGWIIYGQDNLDFMERHEIQLGRDRKTGKLDIDGQGGGYEIG